jgi:pyrroline-5-carboxylate reductase
MATGISLGIIGVGNLGGALAEGVLAADAVGRVYASDASPERLEQLSAALGERFVSGSAAETAAAADLLVMALKPHILPSVVAQIGEALRPETALVSVAAGVKIERLEDELSGDRPIIRAMPNLAMLVSESATALCANEHVSDAQMATAEAIFASVGTVVRVDESQLHAVTALSGSGPAYVCLLIEALAAGGVNRGLHPDIAQALATQTLLGASKLVREKGLHPAVLKDQVTTPAGTTIAGLHQLELHAVRGALIDAVDAAAQRSEELAE